VTVRSTFDRLPSNPQDGTRKRWPSLSALTQRRVYLASVGLLAVGILLWAFGLGIGALWFFMAAAAGFALALPLAQAFVSPLFVGLVGWLVDMLPLVMLVGWGAVCLRWLWSLWRERRLPRGGRWVWLPIGLFFWTALAAPFVPAENLDRFVLLFGIQFLVSTTILACLDSFADYESRTFIAKALVFFVVIMSVGVLLDWIGLPVQSLQDETVSEEIEATYGVDAFQNDTGMIKYARAKNAGTTEVRKELATLRKSNPGLPPAEVLLPYFDGFDKVNIVVRFEGSARPYEDELSRLGTSLISDNVGLHPANTVARLRSFPRNALTYAGVAAAVIPFAFFLALTEERRRKLLGIAGIVCCIFGAGFSLARGAWAAIAVGILYLVIDGGIRLRMRLQVVAAVVIGALVFSGIFFLMYRSDPLSARAGGEGSISTRSDLYTDTLSSSTDHPLQLLVGYGTERVRGGGGLGKYVPSEGTHSTYLNYLFRTGIVGALLLVAIYATVGLSTRAASRLRDGNERKWATFSAVAVVIVAAHALILSLYVEPIYTLTVSLIVGLAMAGAAGVSGSILPWRTQKTS
jgi:O-Antigen ligase